MKTQRSHFWRRICSISVPILISAASLLPGMSIATAENRSDFIIKVDGQAAPVSSFVQNGRLMVPAEFMKRLGVDVGWSSSYQSVLLKKGEKQISLPSGKNYADFTTTGKGQWLRNQLDTINTDRNEGTYIPLRYTVEQLGLSISCNQSTRSIDIKINTADDPYWLYKITEAEAGGESHQGKVAVAATILNRVKSPDWPDTIKNVIFQVTNNNGVDYYQYSPVQDQRIYNVSPSEDTVKAVNEALAGQDPTNGAMVFYNPGKTDNQWVKSRPVVTTIGNHVFAK